MRTIAFGGPGRLASILVSFFASTNILAVSLEPGNIFHWQLEGEYSALPDVDVYDLDLDKVSRDPNLIQTLHAKQKKVVCYFSAGSYESDRPAGGYLDFYRTIPKEAIGNKMKGWTNERWIDIRTREVQNAHQQILDFARRSGCDAVEPDNVDAYDNLNTGFNITSAETHTFLSGISEQAHRLQLEIALKNTNAMVAELHDQFEFAIAESCFTYGGCASFLPFIKNSKPVFVAEYLETIDGTSKYNFKNYEQDCDFAKRNNIYFIVYPTQHLDGKAAFICGEKPRKTPKN